MLNNEVAVVCLCCRVYLQTSTISELKAFLSLHPIRWKQVYQLCAMHRVRPVVLQVLCQLAQEVPKEILQLFRNYCREFLLFAADRKMEADRIVGLLQAQGIAARLYKGTECAMLLYRDIGMREFTDMDIIIEDKQLRAVTDLMLAEGYEMQQAAYFRRFPTRYKRQLKDIAFGKRCPRGRRFSFEFHYRPTKPLMPVQYTFSELLGPDYLNRNYNNQDYYTLLLLNNGASDFFPHLRSLLDMALIWQKEQVTPPAGLKPYDILWRQLAHTLLGFDTHQQPPAHNNTYHLLLRRLQQPQLPGKYTFLQQAYVNLANAETVKEKSRLLQQYLLFLLRPNGNDIETYKLPYPAYYFTKPLRLTFNLLRRIG
ncbi:nucleotidyltransferase family protein [Chitinophaga rhizophila]|uniref:Nucleotidyltransferase family protein n=1 Tax=Chitinophaga rhizophila TaxID=2866212 RepID=A0ABS7GL98_9BACT|nr:nucleotidyltransferase family protein [Chitinophaga rhizophila]MBW8687422.1 nucleotidyltransferase family protein [Chitinophaga rhizophila]